MTPSTPLSANTGLAGGPDRSSSALAISVRDLHKTYGSLKAVSGVDLDVHVGEIFALLGPNGAGKTTTVEILEGYRKRDSGQVSVLGLDPGRQRRELKPRIGIVLQSIGVERYLTVSETLEMFAVVYPHPKHVDQVLALLGLGAQRDRPVNRLSGGQKRRLDMAVALIGDPDLLFLDEPTTGFDPAARREAWEAVKSLVSLGKTVLLTTHFMDEAQYLADRVAVISGGRVVAEGPPATLGPRNPSSVRVRFRLPAGAAPPALGGSTTTKDGFWEAETQEPVRALHDLTGWALDQGVDLEGLEVVRPSLEEVYLELTSNPPGAENAGGPGGSA